MCLASTNTYWGIFKALADLNQEWRDHYISSMPGMVTSVNMAYTVYDQMWEKAQHEIRSQNTIKDNKEIEAAAARQIAAKGVVFNITMNCFNHLMG